MNNLLFSIIVCLTGDSPEFEYYEKMINEFYSGFGYHVQIDGSPFKYRDIDKILSLLQELNIKEVGIRTDEKITTDNIAMMKKYSIRSIMFRDDSEYLEENIKLVQDNNIPIEISIILQKDNIEKIDDLIIKYQKKNIKLLIFERSIIAKYRNKKYNPLSAIEYKNIMQKIINYNRKNNTMGIAISHCPNKILLHKDAEYKNQLGGCSAGVVSCAVDYNGNIIPCLPLYEFVEGNIKVDSITSVWCNSKIFKNLRNRINLKGKCRSCEFLNSCGGCRAEGFFIKGDLFEEDGTCWKEL